MNSAKKKTIKKSARVYMWTYPSDIGEKVILWGIQQKSDMVKY